MSSPFHHPIHLTDAQTERFLATPYLSTVFAPDIHHITLLPSAWEASACMEVATRQVERNGLVTMLALTPRIGVYLSPGREAAIVSSLLPSRLCFTDRIVPAYGALQPPERTAPEDADREGQLAAFIERHRLAPNEVLAVLPATDMSPATPSDVLHLSGPTITGVPAGLQSCAICGYHNGVGIWRERADSEPYIVNVSCPCEDDHRCAGCRQRLHPRGINRFSWDRELDQVVFVGSILALQHRCP